mmetsp:Transcript_7853/g.18029  ORF Transcript_7853/g.18029 Transcript_7853/m.18029 type:complete len:243 (+) Transcript_7853:221-949(+)
MGHCRRRCPVKAQVEASMRKMPWQEVRIALLLEGRHEARLVWEEHDRLVVSITVRVQGVELLKERILSDAQQDLLLGKCLVVLRRCYVVEGGYLAQVRVGTSLSLGIFRRVAVQELCISILWHEVETALPQLLQQRGRAAHSGDALAGGLAVESPGREDVLRGSQVLWSAGVCCIGVHHASELRQVRAFQAQPVLVDDEVELVSSSLYGELSRQRRSRPHGPMRVREVDVSLLCDGEGREPG